MKFLELEKKYAEHTNTRGAISVNTGTAALHVALEALRLPPRAKVIVPEFTMYASALAVYYSRLTPVFVDCDKDLLIDLDKTEKAIDSDTKVLMVTHIYGRIVNMDRVMELAHKYDLRVIEDACEAQGATWNGRPVGSFDIGCFSLYRNKIICAEEGGIVSSNDTEFLSIVRDMKSMSFGETHDYHHKQIGFNYRMTNSQAAIALESLSKAEWNISRREYIKNKFNSLFSKNLLMPDNRDVVWVYDMKHPRADKVVKKLKSLGIAARHAFKPMSHQPLFNEAPLNNNLNAKRYSEEVFYLHINPTMSDGEIDRIAQIVSKVCEEL